MAATIYYFSATGNSLHAARSIARQIGDCGVANIASLAGQSVVEDGSDTIGIVFPIYFLQMPGIVREFVKRLRPREGVYVFSVATYGERPGAAHRMLDGLLRENGSRLSAGFNLRMPDNAYIGYSVVTPPERREPMLKAADEELARIAGIVKRREKHAAAVTDGRLIVAGSHLLAMAVTDVYRLPRRFNVTDRCKGCGICEKVCPMGNISRIDGRVTWGERCAMCLACFHWCPAAAVQIGRRSAGIARYHHPAVKVKDVTYR